MLDENSLLTKWFFAVTPLVSSAISALKEIAAVLFLRIKVPTKGSSIVAGSPLLALSDRKRKTCSHPFLQMSLF